jgi:DNA-directed RNA polymerase specialized sigma24 family protein
MGGLPGASIAAVIAVRMEDLGAALARVDPESRALLELSLRRGLPDEEIGEFLRVDPQEIGRRREALFERLAEELGVQGREERDELYATLRDLPDRHWSAQAARA